MEYNNKIITVQEMLMRQMERLDDNQLMFNESNNEIARSNALTNSATAYLKAVNTTLRIIETANKNEVTTNALMKTIGIGE